MNSRLMPQNSGESDLIWLFLTLETPTREKLMQGYPPIVPCHRVVRSDGSLGGYSAEGGVETKRRLLSAEGVEFSAPS